MQRNEKRDRKRGKSGESGNGRSAKSEKVKTLRFLILRPNIHRSFVLKKIRKQEGVFMKLLKYFRHR